MNKRLFQQPASGTVWRLFVTYRDSTGPAPSASAIARLVRVSRLTGGTTVAATFNSNNNSETGITRSGIVFNHSFNFDVSYYVVQIALDRTLANQIVEVFGVALERL